ncbi:MAG: sigma-70 family RNA polymerase sigma factor [Planctomycetota bacterium]
MIQKFLPAGAGASAPAHAADLRLVGEVLAGDEIALERLLARFRCIARFVALSNSRLGGALTTHDKEETCQDVLAVLWHKLREFRGGASLETWAFRITDLTVRNAVRKAVRRRMASLSDVEDVVENEWDVVDQVESVRTALTRLPAADAALLRAKHFEGLAFEAIAQWMAISTNTVKSRYYRALSALRLDLLATVEP